MDRFRFRHYVKRFLNDEKNDGKSVVTIGGMPTWDGELYFNIIIFPFTIMTNLDLIIGVHCTHGVNRTGYLIAKYLIKEKRYTPKKAVECE